MRIGLVIWSMFTLRGGIERVGAMLANEMSKRGHKVIVFCQNIPPSGQPVYPLSPSVSCVSLDLDTQESLAAARQKVKQCNLDVMCAMFSWDALLWIPALMDSTGVPLVISEHNHPDIIENERWNAYERRACLAAADKIHVLNNAFYSMLPTFLQERAVVIPNPVATPLPIPANREQTKHKRIIAAGRMVDSHKQFSLLLHAFQILASSFQDWDLCICGDGPDSELYKHLAQKLGIQNRVQFPGMVDNIEDYYANSHIFCIPSRYEGFGLVTVEAQRHGLPAIGFADCTGTNEIIIHGENGLLAPEQTPVAIAASLRVLMKDGALRQTMAKKSQELLARYDEQAVMNHWEDLFVNTEKLRGHTKLCALKHSEQSEIECSLVEILRRNHPYSRPVCAKIEQENKNLMLKFKQALVMLQQTCETHIPLLLKNLHLTQDTLSRINFFFTIEELQTYFFLSLIKNLEINYFFDIGANVGFYSLLYKKYFSQYYLYCFEPSPRTYFNLEKNIKSNFVSGAHLFNIGLSDMKGEVEFYEFDNNSGKNSIKKSSIHKPSVNTKINKIQVDLLDNIVRLTGKKIFLKIDVEGHELQALQSAVDLILNNETVIQIELGHKESSAIKGWLSKYGLFKFYTLGPDSYFSNINFDKEAILNYSQYAHELLLAHRWNNDFNLN